VCCSVLQCVAVCCSVLQCVAVCCSVLQCVAVCCSVLQCVFTALSRRRGQNIHQAPTANDSSATVFLPIQERSWFRPKKREFGKTLCTTLIAETTHSNPPQPTTTYCNILQHTATYCNTQQHTATQMRMTDKGAAASEMLRIM